MCTHCDGAGHTYGDFVECPTCAGLGTIDDDSPGTKVCPVCEGDGEVHELNCHQCGGFGTLDTTALTDGELESACPACQGNGSIPDPKKCRKCDGRGTVEEKFEKDVTPLAS